ncbi:hypothetical protein DMB42_17975 [Nonomuraea sp. WAC 01424]|nr:hypothetical protein DMB42_17975 [Nonomuraea sp. WAC 01424]
MINRTPRGGSEWQHLQNAFIYRMGLAVIAATNAGRLLVGLLVVIGATSCATAGEDGHASPIRSRAAHG